MFHVLLVCSVLGAGEFTPQQVQYLQSLKPGEFRYREYGGFEVKVPALAPLPFGTSIIKVPKLEESYIVLENKRRNLSTNEVVTRKFHVVEGNHRWLLNEYEWNQLIWLERATLLGWEMPWTRERQGIIFFFLYPCTFLLSGVAGYIVSARSEKLHASIVATRMLAPLLIMSGIWLWLPAPLGLPFVACIGFGFCGNATYCIKSLSIKRCDASLC